MRKRTAVVSLFAAATLFASERNASADERMIIKYPGDHPIYRFDAEPHGLLGFAGPLGYSGAFGAGFRGTVIVADNGFIKTINNSVGIGFTASNSWKGGDTVYPVFGAGGRYHFNEKIALTMRLGFPAISVGVSFLF